MLQKILETTAQPKGRLSGAAEDLLIEALLVAEVVVDRGDVELGPPADLANPGIAKALVGKDLGRDLQESLSAVGVGGGGSHGPVRQLERLSETNV